LCGANLDFVIGILAAERERSRVLNQRLRDEFAGGYDKRQLCTIHIGKCAVAMREVRLCAGAFPPALDGVAQYFGYGLYEFHRLR
jgi:hypothetical protein